MLETPDGNILQHGNRLWIGDRNCEPFSPLKQKEDGHGIGNEKPDHCGL